jgi:hypothetical protein
MEINNNKKNNQLRGRENYLAWLTRMEGLLSIDDILERDTATDTLTILGADAAAKLANEKKAKKYLLQNCDDKVMHSINPTEDFTTIIEKLNSAYGFGHMDPAIILALLREIKFHPSKDPSITLNEIDIRLAELEYAGGTITDAQMVQYMHDGLSGDPLRDAFWFNCRGAMNIAKLSTFKVESAGKYIVQFWYAFKPKKIAEVANYGREKGKKFEKRFCQFCKDGNREKIMGTHNSKDCRIQKQAAGNGGEEASNLSENKEASNYSSRLYHDSGTSKTMLNFKPGKILEENLSIPIYTAGANQKPQYATSKGILQLGPIELEALEVPSFSKNLLSATQLSIEHGCKQVIEPWTSKLTISKDDKIIATGTYDKASKLIKIDEYDANNVEVSEVSVPKVAQVLPQEQPTPPKRGATENWITVHRKMGHLGPRMMKKTLQVTKGLEISNKYDKLKDTCDICPTTKAKRNKISKGDKTPHELLDVVEIDIQGPFPITANDGTNSNIKIIDSRSSWLYFITVPDTKASTALDIFLPYQAKIERQTGLKIKRVRTDGGPEIMGEFLAYLELSGIIKEKGVPYTHHHPGKVERAHQTVLRHARAMLKESLLPPKYYNEAQNTAVYLFNRTVHGKDTITPYEHIFKRAPNLKHLKPFGTVCYAFIPPEKRSKLEDSGIKCRLLGYGDDFETEEIKGYKLLNESDGTIFWSDSVIFDQNGKMEKLNDIFYSYEDDSIRDTLWTPFLDESPDQEEDDEFYYNTEETEEQLSENEMSNLIQELQKETWWKKNLKNPTLTIHSALKAVVEGIPVSYKQAMESSEAAKWKLAMDVEMKSLKENGTFKLYQKQHGEKSIGCRWVFKKKLKSDGSLDRYKARLVAKGYLQQFGRDYNETFAPVAKYKSIRLLLALAAHFNQKVYQDDATSAFLNGLLKEKVIMDQPEGFIVKSTDYKWLLQKTLYGLKQAPREWNEVFHKFMIENEFTQSQHDPCLYVKIEENSTTLVGVYVDDVISTGSNDERVAEFRSALQRRFKCSKGGLLTWALGMEIIQDSFKISINQNQYVQQKLNEFTDFLEENTKRSIPLDPNFQKLLIAADESSEMETTFPYRQIVGSLMYAATGTRPDIIAAVAIASRFLANPKKIHCNMVRQILYYLRQQPLRPLVYRKYQNPQLEVYCDSSYANNDDYSSISGFAVMFGKNLVSWSSKKQPVIALSSTEAEYVAATGASQEALWFQGLLQEIGINQETIIIYEDNESCIKLAQNPQEFNRTRHIQVKYHFIRLLVKENKIKLLPIRTKHQLADIFTKGVNGPRLKDITQRLGLESNQHGRESNYVDYYDTRRLNYDTRRLN